MDSCWKGAPTAVGFIWLFGPYIIVRRDGLSWRCTQDSGSQGGVSTFLIKERRFLSLVVAVAVLGTTKGFLFEEPQGLRLILYAGLSDQSGIPGRRFGAVQYFIRHC